MVDYTRSTGSQPGATMMIRDKWSPGSDNYNVEFWINSNNTGTFHYQLPWSYIGNGVQSPNLQFRYEKNMGWQRLGVYNQWGSGNVSFKLGATGTIGFGGPTTLTVFINRATVPPAPSAVRFSNLSSTSVTGTFDSNGDGGSTLFAWQFGYGTDPNTPQSVFDALISHTFVGLNPGTTYYFWARGRNAQGNGPWSPRSQITTHRSPDAPSAPLLTNHTQKAITVSFAPNGDGGTPITGYQAGYSTDPNNIEPSVLTGLLTTGSPITMANLQPATTYYFRTRVKNNVGWGPWSPQTVGKTIAGARVKVGSVWKDAVPYVKDGGVWKLARPWVREIGVWKETS